jgi:tetratricopeptide (TPR) repeat protein
MKKLFILLFLLSNILCFAQETKQLDKQEADKKVEKGINSLEKQLYHPFVENYILNEIKTLRDENRDLKIELHKTLAKKEVEISNNVINYATSTLNNMFYIIAAASSFLVLMGWNSIKDINKKVKNDIDEKISKTISDYEKRLNLFEEDLEKRSKQVVQNQKNIEKTNTIYSLWMRASKESTTLGKIEIYDEILNLSPDDVEALTYKAEAVLKLDEANWALSLANQAIKIDDEFSNAFYQRAKILYDLGQIDSCIEDLEKALELNEQYVEKLKKDKFFFEILEDERFSKLIEKYTAEEVV